MHNHILLKIIVRYPRGTLQHRGTVYSRSEDLSARVEAAEYNVPVLYLFVVASITVKTNMVVSSVRVLR